MIAKENCTLYSGGLKGAESAFGEAAEKCSIKVVEDLTDKITIELMIY